MGKRFHREKRKAGKDVFILGAGGFARETFNIYVDVGRESEVLGFLEENSKRDGEIMQGKPIRKISYLKQFSAKNKPVLIAAIGSTKRRRLIEALESEGYEFDRVIHPSAIFSSWVSLGSGSIVAAGVIMTSQIEIGRHVILNLGVQIGHDVNVSNFVTISPGVKIMGQVNIEEEVTIGANATLIDNVTVGRSSIIAAGAVVIEDVPKMSLVAGVPAKQKKIYRSLTERPW